MILRRVIEHVREQNWTAIVLDFAIVVLGVFIGLQVQEWSVQQADRRQERQIVADLLADLEIDRSQYANGIALALRRISAANQSLRGAGVPPIEFDWDMPSQDLFSYSLDPAELESIPEAKHDRLWTLVALGSFAYPTTTTLDAIVGSGDIKIFADRALVRELQIYRTLADSVARQNEKVQDIRSNVLNVGMDHGLAPFGRIPADDYFRLVSNEPDLAAAIRTQGAFAFFHLGEYRTADTGAAKLQERLQDYLARRD